MLIFRGLGITKVANPGQITTFEFTVQRPGTYEINCGMLMMEGGKLIVES